MGLSTELISEFVKITNDNKKSKEDNIVYGTVSTVSEDGKSGTVKIDGSDEATPVSTTCTIQPGDRVRLNIRNHNAIVTGNMSSPAFGVQEANGLRSEIFQTLSEISLEVENEIAGLDAKLTLTASEIRSEVSNTVSGLSSRITQTENAISSLVKGPEGYSELKQTFDALTFITENGVVKLSGGNIKLTGSISFSDLSDSASVQSDIDAAYDYASDAYDVADTAWDKADDALDTVSGWAHSSNGTYIDGEMIYSDSIYANSIHLGGCLDVYKTTKGSTVGGYLGYDSGFNSTSGIGIRDASEVSQVVCTDEAARMSCGDPRYDSKYAQFVADDTGYAWVEASNAIIFEIDAVPQLAVIDGCFRPHTDTAGSMYLGHSSYRWAAVYATNGTIQTSDRNYKNNIEHLPDKYITLFDNITPRRFKMNEGSSGRYHVGYIAQEVEEAMFKAGIDSLEFGGFVRDVDVDGNEICMLRYDEFDAIYALKLKMLERIMVTEFDWLKARVAALEER